VTPRPAGPAAGVQRGETGARAWARHAGRGSGILFRELRAAVPDGVGHVDVIKRLGVPQYRVLAAA